MRKPQLKAAHFISEEKKTLLMTKLDNLLHVLLRQILACTNEFYQIKHYTILYLPVWTDREHQCAPVGFPGLMTTRTRGLHFSLALYSSLRMPSMSRAQPFSSFRAYLTWPQHKETMHNNIILLGRRHNVKGGWNQLCKCPRLIVKHVLWKQYNQNGSKKIDFCVHLTWKHIDGNLLDECKTLAVGERR